MAAVTLCYTSLVGYCYIIFSGEIFLREFCPLALAMFLREFCHLALKSEPGQLTANQRFRHSDLITDFVTVILSQSDGLGKMAIRIVKYAYDHSSQLIGVIWFMASLFAVSL